MAIADAESCRVFDIEKVSEVNGRWWDLRAQLAEFSLGCQHLDHLFINCHACVDWLGLSHWLVFGVNPDVVVDDLHGDALSLGLELRVALDHSEQEIVGFLQRLLHVVVSLI